MRLAAAVASEISEIPRNSLKIQTYGVQSRDRMGPVRTGTTFLFFFGARNGVPVLFHDVEPFICYILIRDSYFYVLFVVHYTLHTSHVPLLNVLD